MKAKKKAAPKQPQFLSIDLSKAPKLVGRSRSGLLGAWFFLVSVLDIWACAMGLPKFEHAIKKYPSLSEWPASQGGIPIAILQPATAIAQLFGGMLPIGSVASRWNTILQICSDWNYKVETGKTENLPELAQCLINNITLDYWNLFNSVGLAWAVEVVPAIPDDKNPYRPYSKNYLPIPWRPELARPGEVAPYIG